MAHPSPTSQRLFPDKYLSIACPLPSPPTLATPYVYTHGYPNDYPHG